MKKTSIKILSFIFSFFIGLTVFQIPSIAENDSALAFVSRLNQMISENDSDLVADEIEMGIILRDRLIVKTNTRQELNIANSNDVIASVSDNNGLYVLQYADKTSTQTAFQSFSDMNSVEYVEYDFTYVADFPDCIGPGTLEDYDNISWGSDTVNTNIGFLLMDFLVSSWDPVSVAVIDSGLDATHSFFADRVNDGYDFIRDRTDVMDGYGHGTHVSGIVVDNTRSNVKINPYRVLDSNGRGDYAVTCKAIEYAVKHGADVINMSLGWKKEKYPNAFNTFQSALNFANANNVSVIVTAGNEGYNANNKTPASNTFVITVSAIDSEGNPTSFSNFGNCVDVAAPGYDIYSTLPNEQYDLMSGTSMAAPFVSAAAAILKTISPDITPAQVKERICATATCPEGWDTNYGSGIVSFARMITNRRTGDLSVQLSNDGMVTMRSASPNAHIYYTTDGSDPEIGVSTLYTEPFRVPNAQVIKAIAYEEGALPTDVVSYRLQWGEEITVRYKGSKKVEFPTGYRIKRIYDGNNDIATLTYDGKITSVSVGETVAVVEFTNNCRANYHIHVEYAWWQQLIRYFLFGFLWY